MTLSSSESRPLHVLIVEDVEPMRALLEHILAGAEGILVSGSAKNGWEARLELTRRRPDVVVLDEILPGESGLDLLREIVQQKIPVVLITGLTDPTHSLPEGAFGRLTKPGWKSLETDRKRFREVILAAGSAAQN